MSTPLFAQKGEAAPARGALEQLSPSRPIRRRLIIMRPIDVDNRSTEYHAQRECAQPQSRDPRKHFTFRLDPERHRAFHESVRRLGCSGQQLLTKLLDDFLAKPSETIG